MVLRVFVDANVLYSRTTRDWLFSFRIAADGLFQLHCTEDVFAEVIYHLRKAHPRWSGVAAAAAAFRTVIDEIVDAFPEQIPFTGADEGDYHVHAAAVHSGADVILTSNKASDFTTGSAPYRVMTPDEFFIHLSATAPDALLAAVRSQSVYWTKRGDGIRLDAALRSAGCPRFADRVAALL